MAVINGADYRAISVAYANARETILSAKDFFFDAVYLIAVLNVIKPEVDLLVDFYDGYQINTQLLRGTSLFEAAVRSMQQHVLTEGGYTNVDAYLDAEGITVPRAWEQLSAQAGFAISDANVD